jgi:hypothetical protein
VGLQSERQTQSDLTVDVLVQIDFDSFPPETGWSISSSATGALVANASIGTYVLGETSASEAIMLNVGEEYIFTIEDGYGDGLCCTSQGTYAVFQSETELVSGGGNFGMSESTPFATPIDGQTPAEPAPTPASVSPTEAPATPAPVLTTVSPIGSPTPLPASSPLTPGGTVDVTLLIVFDRFPEEIGWAISSAASEEIVAYAPLGTFSPLAESATETISLQEGESYVFIIEDGFGDGLCCPNPAAYVITQGDTELVSGGGNFGRDETTIFVTLVESVQATTPSPSPTPVDSTTASPTVTESADASITPGVTPEPSNVASADAAVEITVFIEFDAFPQETGWIISRNDTGTVVASKPIGTYPMLTTGTVSEPVILMVGVTYDFTILDLFGDGLFSKGNPIGTYALFQSTEAGTVELVAGGGNFGESNSTPFTPAPV